MTIDSTYLHRLRARFVEGRRRGEFTAHEARRIVEMFLALSVAIRRADQARAEAVLATLARAV